MRRLSLFAAALFAATAALAASAWEGTWTGGWDDSEGVQLIIAGDQAVGLAIGDDYVSELTSSIRDKTMTIRWAGGDATATLTDEGIDIVAHPAGQPDVVETLTPSY